MSFISLIFYSFRNGDVRIPKQDFGVIMFRLEIWEGSMRLLYQRTGIILTKTSLYILKEKGAKTILAIIYKNSLVCSKHVANE